MICSFEFILKRIGKKERGKHIEEIIEYVGFLAYDFEKQESTRISAQTRRIAEIWRKKRRATKKKIEYGGFGHVKRSYIPYQKKKDFYFCKEGWMVDEKFQFSSKHFIRRHYEKA
jgi:hypothetical protein